MAIIEKVEWEVLDKYSKIMKSFIFSMSHNTKLINSDIRDMQNVWAGDQAKQFYEYMDQYNNNIGKILKDMTNIAEKIQIKAIQLHDITDQRIGDGN